MSSAASLERGAEGLRILIPLKLHKRSGRKELVLPSGASAGRAPRGHRPLCVALARAFHWQGLLDSGRFRSSYELVAALELDRAYVARQLKLALLPPRTVEAVLAGKEPPGTSVAGLIKQAARREWRR